MYIYPYKDSSESAKALARQLGIKRIKCVNSHFKGGWWKHVINWGATNLPYQVDKCVLHNNQNSVAIAANKLEFFSLMENEQDEEVALPEFTTDKQTSIKWILGGDKVVCRTILNGHSGAGIVIAKIIEELVDAPLYVKYIPKKDEYRIHVGRKGWQIIDVQKKGRDKGVADDDVNWQVRNHQNGFIYMREDVNPPEQVLTYAKNCVRILGLDFGAVDIIYNQKNDQAYVLEVNTAPGLTGTTLEKYAEYFRQFI